MPRLRHIAAAVVVLVAIAGIAIAAQALPGGSSGSSAAESTPSLRPHAAHAMAVPDGADARHRSLAQEAKGRQVVAYVAAVRKAQEAAWYQGVIRAQQAAWFEGVHQAQLAQQAQAAAAARAAAAQQAAAAQAASTYHSSSSSTSSSSSSTSSSGSSSSGSSSAGSGACGGSLPSCCIMQHESGGSATAMNASGAAGKWQIMPGTWAGYGGYSSAAQAPVAVQDAKAAQLWAGGAGASNWAGDGC